MTNNHTNVHNENIISSLSRVIQAVTEVGDIWLGHDMLQKANEV